MSRTFRGRRGGRSEATVERNLSKAGLNLDGISIEPGKARPLYALQAVIPGLA
jgi:hypothetical protein